MYYRYTSFKVYNNYYCISCVRCPFNTLSRGLSFIVAMYVCFCAYILERWILMIYEIRIYYMYTTRVIQFIVIVLYFVYSFVAIVSEVPPRANFIDTYHNVCCYNVSICT